MHMQNTVTLFIKFKFEAKERFGGFAYIMNKFGELTTEWLLGFVSNWGQVELPKTIHQTKI